MHLIKQIHESKEAVKSWARVPNFATVDGGKLTRHAGHKSQPANRILALRTSSQRIGEEALGHVVAGFMNFRNFVSSYLSGVALLRTRPYGRTGLDSHIREVQKPSREWP